MWDKSTGMSVFVKKNTAKLAIIGICMLNGGNAHALTADDVLNKMNSKEQTTYITGVVGGFAYSRYLRDSPDKTGMNCIYGWFHGEKNRSAWNQIDAWFSRHLDKPVEPLLYVLIKRECGE